MRNILRTFNNSLGVSMIQALVGSFVASIVALGVSTMLVNSKIQTRKIQLLNTLSEQKSRFEFLLRDQAAFSNIVNNNTGTLFTQLKAGSATEVAYTSPVKVKLFDSVGNTAYEGLDLFTSGIFTASGTTEKGNPCTTFNGGAGLGNDDCPISYRILIGAECGPGTTGTNCRDPQLKIVARMIYNPSTASYSQLDKFRNLLPLENTAIFDSVADSIHDGKYDAVVKRTASSIGRNFQLSVAHTNMAAGSGPGTCNSFWETHKRLVSAGWTIDYDPHSLVASVNTGGNGRIVFSEGGYYSCTISAPAFGVNGFSIKLYDVTNARDIAIGSSVAPQWVESTARLETSFNVTNPSTTVFSVYFRCDAHTPDPVAGEYELGMSRAPYNIPFPMVLMTCSKVDNAF